LKSARRCLSAVAGAALRPQELLAFLIAVVECRRLGRSRYRDQKQASVESRGIHRRKLLLLR
jgi:hypothetical protein